MDNISEAGPVLGMFELFGGTGPPISGGRQIRSLIFFNDFSENKLTQIPAVYIVKAIFSLVYMCF